MKRTLKRFLCVICCLLIAFQLVGCSSKTKDNKTDTGEAKKTETAGAEESATAGESVSEETYNWIAAASVGEDTVNGIILRRFKENIEEASKGRITVEIYMGGALGGDKEIHNGLTSGSVDFVASTTSNLLLVCPEAAVFDAPYLFEDVDFARKVLADFLPTFNPYAEACGVHILGFSDLGLRIMTSNSPIEKLDDFKGLTIRTMENKYQMKFCSLVGATATPTDFSEVYTALQQGAVDGQSNAAELTVSSKFYEPQKYLIMTNHEMHIVNFLMSNELYKSLPTDIKTMVDECAIDAIVYGNEQSTLRYDEKIKVLADNLEVIEWDDATLSAVKEAVQPEWDTIREDVGDDLVNTLLEAIEAAK